MQLLVLAEASREERNIALGMDFDIDVGVKVKRWHSVAQYHSRVPRWRRGEDESHHTYLE